jgi:glycosyltransferase involved in cell wall biosynthesis
MRFAVLHHGDPLTEMLWAGIPLNIARTLREMGHEVEIIGNLTPQVPLFSRLKTQFYKRILNKMYLINRDPAVFAARARGSNRRLKAAGRLDAVLITYPADAAYLETDVPLLIVHDAAWTQLVDFYPGAERSKMAPETLRGGIKLDKAGLARCRQAIYCSQWAVEGVIRDYGVPRSKLSVAPLGACIVNPPRREDVARYLKSRLQGPMKFFFLGWEWYRKGGDIAMAVVEQVEALGFPVELHVAGSKPQGALPAWVKLHGPLRKDNPEEAATLRGLFETSDFFIMPTRADTFGLVYAESAAFGMPVIASNVGGVPEAAKGEWGLTLPLDTPPRVIAEWAVKLYKDRAAYERLAWLARESYETRLNWLAFCSRLVEVAAGEIPLAATAEGCADFV